MSIPRRTTRGYWLLAGAILVAGALGSIRVAWAGQWPDPSGMCARVEGFLTRDDRDAVAQIVMKRAQERLGLTDQQAKELQALLKSLRDDARADLQALCEARQEFRQLMARQDSEPAALRAAADRLKALRGRLLDRRVDGQLALRSKLTAEQWAKWLELRIEMRHRGMGRGRGFAS